MYLKQNHTKTFITKKILFLRYNNVKNEIEIENISKYPLKIVKLINTEESFLKEFELYLYPGQINRINLENNGKKIFEFKF